MTIVYMISVTPSQDTQVLETRSPITGNDLRLSIRYLLLDLDYYATVIKLTKVRILIIVKCYIFLYKIH